MKMHHIDIAHMVVSSVIHGAVYGVLYHLFKELGLAGSIAMAAVLIGGAWFVSRKMGR